MRKLNGFYRDILQTIPPPPLPFPPPAAHCRARAAGILSETILRRRETIRSGMEGWRFGGASAGCRLKTACIRLQPMGCRAAVRRIVVETAGFRVETTRFLMEMIRFRVETTRFHAKRAVRKSENVAFRWVLIPFRRGVNRVAMAVLHTGILLCIAVSSASALRKSLISVAKYLLIRRHSSSFERTGRHSCAFGGARKFPAALESFRHFWKALESIRYKQQNSHNKDREKELLRYSTILWNNMKTF